MKMYLFLLITALFATAVTAQDAMLTKEETINYLSKKVREADSGSITTKAGRHTFKATSLKASGANIEIKYSRAFGDGVTMHISCSFNPAHAKSVLIADKTKDDTVNTANIIFHGKVAKCDVHSTNPSGAWIYDSIKTGEMYDLVRFPFLDAVPGNRGRVEKALNHLIDLAKAEDDPFGN